MNIQHTEARKKIQAGMEREILNAVRAKVEITMMGENTWSICGSPSHAERAMAFLGTSNLATELDRSSLDGELFIYFKTGA
jgi:hypothetical protein